jgi:hypothetical protein
MTQQIINVGAAANDGTGEPLRNAFTAVNDNFTQIWTAGPVGSQVQITGNIVTTTVTNLGLTLAGNGVGNIQANSTIVPGTSGVYDLGAPDRTFQYIYGDYLVGNGALITGIVANTSYNNSNVAAFLPTYTGNLVSLTGPVRTTANVIAGNIITSGFLGVTGAITGGNITGNNLISSGSVSAVGNITTAGNISGNYLLGNGAFITGITATNIAAGALTGTTLSSNVLFSSLQVVGNLLYVNVDGNVTTTGRFIGSGAGLTNIPAANISGTVANATYATTAGTAYSVAGANVTGTVANATYATTAGSAATATTANTANTVAGANVTGTVANAAYAGTAGSATSASTANTAATVTTAAQPNITSVGTLTSVTVSGNATAGNVLTSGKISATGNISGNYFIGNGALLTGIASNASANANALVGSTLSANVLYSSLQVVGNLVSVNVDGNVTTQGRFIGSGAGLTNIPGANVTGNVANATYATTAGTATTANTANTAVTVTANAQPNITSVGTLTSVSVAGNARVDRLNIGQANLFLINTSPPVLEIQADSTQFSANINVVDKITTAYLSAYNTVSAAGNIIGGNLVTTGNATANYFIGNGRQLTGIVATEVSNLANLIVTGNTTTGNLLTGGLISAVGNIKTVGNVSGNYFIGNGALLTGITVSAGTAIVNGNSNVNVGANGNVTIGVTGTSNISVFTPAGVEVKGLVSATGNVTASGVITTGPSGNISGANVISATTFTATANITGGNVLTIGIVSATGNVFGNAILSDHYYYANGTPVPTGIIYTAAVSPPSGPAVGDQWYNTTSDVLYEYINDGTSSYWVDSNSPAFAGGVVANVAISGTLVPVANVTYDIGTNTVYFRNTYTQNLYTNNRLPAYNMPLGAVVQTVMSSSLGGSITNSTGYADINHANVTITPSSSTSKVLILATGTSSFTSLSGQDVSADTQLVRSPSTSLQIQTCGTTWSGGGIGITGAVSYSYMDSPGTTGAVTYKLQQKVSNASSTLTSTNIWLIALEIAAS